LVGAGRPPFHPVGCSLGRRRRPTMQNTKKSRSS